MKCEKCHQQNASVHLTLNVKADLQTFHYCETCAELFLNSSDDNTNAHLRWQLYGTETEGLVHLNVQILRIEGDTIIVRVTKSSMYTGGSELAFYSSFISQAQRKVGNILGFTCTREQISQIVAQE